jgi:hypothetical protein
VSRIEFPFCYPTMDDLWVQERDDMRTTPRHEEGGAELRLTPVRSTKRHHCHLAAA